MNLRIQVRYYTKTCSWLCFRHAVAQALKGEEVHTELDDYDVEYYLGTTRCVVCSQGAL